MNNQHIDYANFDDADGNPAGGTVKGVGLHVEWQDGPLGRGEDRKEPNGTFVETVIRATAQRIAYYQGSRFHCVENQIALDHLNAALGILSERTRARDNRGVEGTHAA